MDWRGQIQTWLKRMGWRETSTHYYANHMIQTIMYLEWRQIECPPPPDVAAAAAADVAAAAAAAAAVAAAEGVGSSYQAYLWGED